MLWRSEASENERDVFLHAVSHCSGQNGCSRGNLFRHEGSPSENPANPHTLDRECPALKGAREMTYPWLARKEGMDPYSSPCLYNPLW